VSPLFAYHLLFFVSFLAVAEAVMSQQQQQPEQQQPERQFCDPLPAHVWERCIFTHIEPTDVLNVRLVSRQAREMLPFVPDSNADLVQICIRPSHTWPTNVDALRWHWSSTTGGFPSPGSEIWKRAFVIAAYHGQLEVMKWMWQQLEERATSTTASDMAHEALQEAVKKGHLDVVQWIVGEQPSVRTMPNTIDHAAMMGQLHVLMWLLPNRPDDVCTPAAMDGAAGEGDMAMVEWLHITRNEGCTTNAMDFAAESGHLGMMQWLKANRNEGCTAKAMDGAATNGHVHVLDWLQIHLTNGSVSYQGDDPNLCFCTAMAMTYAVLGGHTEAVRWLHAHHRNAGCYSAAMHKLAVCGDLDTYKLLHETMGANHMGVMTTDNAARHGRLEVLRYIFDRRPFVYHQTGQLGAFCTDQAVRLAISGRHREVVRWLCDIQPLGVSNTVALEGYRYLMMRSDFYTASV